jgi:hypothetical protein
MMYHLSLQTAGIVAGVFLLILGLIGIILPDKIRSLAGKFPRSMTAGAVLLSLSFLWSFWLLATMEMGEFSSFRRPLLFILPVGFILILRFVNEFLAVRALGILCLLAAEPLLEAAFLRYESSRLLVTVFAYLLIVAGLFWVTMPYLLRDQIAWSARSSARWRVLHIAALLYGAAMLVCAFTRY